MKNNKKKDQAEHSQTEKKKESDLKERKYWNEYLQVFAKNQRRNAKDEATAKFDFNDRNNWFNSLYLT